ncbi:MAG TPA: CCA tRNA nucleotidyltransferase, partial [Planctomycetota bacterium]|nr:CCA tRNA nucleotidyltransferase [Planctomycetota bacterium]
MQPPSAQSMPAQLLACARFVAQRVAVRGKRAWLLGGPVRDLALGREPHDLDMASALTPEQIEALFDRTSAVGKAFGTVLVHHKGIDVQLTTFRRERGFSDARRPDLVEYTEELAEDARRRDFTCNALYLDPLDDELRDPEGGLRDIGERRLRAVGDPRARFAEDGLRLVRFARFAAALDFSVETATLVAATESAQALAGVSPERRLGELERIFSAPRSERAIELLAGAQLLDALLPGFRAVCPDERALTRRLRTLTRLGEGGSRLGAALGFAVLLEPPSLAEEAAARAILEFLRPSRALRDAVEALWRLARAASTLADERAAPDRSSGPGGRAALVRFARAREAHDALRLARAWCAADGKDERGLARLARASASLSSGDLFPPPLITSDDLARAGIVRGP